MNAEGRGKEMYEKNFGMLTGWMQQTLEQVDDDTLWSRIEVKLNESGSPVCMYNKDGHRFHITSDRPVEEARQWYASRQDLEGSGAVFLYGCGFGYPLLEVFKHKKSHTLVVVIEQDICLFKAMLYYFDLEQVIKSSKVAFLLGDCEYFAKAFELLFFNTFFISSTYPGVAFTLPAQRQFNDIYTAIHREVFTKLSLFVFYLGNDHYDNLLGFVNLMANVKHIAENPYISCLKDRYRGFPAFIVANGPSLDRNIDLLRLIRGRGLIICMESAIVPLLKHGIEPDILAVIERVPASYEFHFKSIDYPEDIALLGLAVADPRIFPAFPGEKIPILRAKEIVNLWTSHLLGDDSVIDAGLNVSHLATELAVYLGAGPVIFVGQDFAYGEGEQTHSMDSVYAEEKARQINERIKSRVTVYTDGNDGAPVRSNELWMDFKKGLELKIAEHAECTFLNATQGGARIAGTEYIRLEKAIDKYCILEIPDKVHTVIRENRLNISRQDRELSIVKFMDSIRRYITLFRDVARVAVNREIECMKMMHLPGKNHNGEYNNMLEESYQANVGIFGKLIQDGMFRCFLQQVVFANYYLINRMKMIDTPEKIQKVFTTHYNFFDQIRVVCQSLSVHFEDALILLETDFPRLKEGERGQ